MIQQDKEVRERTENLLDAIKCSRTYREYVTAREELCRYPDRKRKADQFRRDNYIARNNPVDDSAGERAGISIVREQLRLDPVIDNYLNKELVLCRMLKDSAMKILNAAELDLDGFDDVL